MAKNGHSQFFLTPFSKKTHTYIFSDNFFQKDWYKFGMAKNDHSEFYSDNFSQKD